jgi:hypothetical protein
VSAVTRSQIEHGAALAQVAGKVDGLAGKADGQGETLAAHGQMLTEILRRLPAPPE